MFTDSIGRQYSIRPGRKERPIKERFMEYVEVRGGHWMWTGTVTKFGYPQIWFEGKSVRAHRLALILFVSDPPTAKHQADHVCHVKLCVRPHPKHLRWATPSENTRNYHPDGRFHVIGRGHGKK